MNQAVQADKYTDFRFFVLLEIISSTRNHFGTLISTIYCLPQLMSRVEPNRVRSKSTKQYQINRESNGFCRCNTYSPVWDRLFCAFCFNDLYKRWKKIIHQAVFASSRDTLFPFKKSERKKTHGNRRRLYKYGHLDRL